MAPCQAIGCQNSPANAIARNAHGTYQLCFECQPKYVAGQVRD